jgi:hypothetical protein
MVEATGTYIELHDSGLNFAKQLGLEVETADNPEEHHSLSPSDSKLSLKTKRQSSETSDYVSIYSLKYGAMIVYWTLIQRIMALILARS